MASQRTEGSNIEASRLTLEHDVYWLLMKDIQQNLSPASLHMLLEGKVRPEMGSQDLHRLYAIHSWNNHLQLLEGLTLGREQQEDMENSK